MWCQAGMWSASTGYGADGGALRNALGRLRQGRGPKVTRPGRMLAPFARTGSADRPDRRKFSRRAIAAPAVSTTCSFVRMVILPPDSSEILAMTRKVSARSSRAPNNRAASRFAPRSVAHSRCDGALKANEIPAIRQPCPGKESSFEVVPENFAPCICTGMICAAIRFVFASDAFVPLFVEYCALHACPVQATTRAHGV